MKKRWCIGFLAVLLCCLLGMAAAEEYVEERVVTVSPLTAVLPVTGGSVEVSAKEIDGETWLFLPSFASADTLALSLDGRRVQLNGLEEWEEGVLWGEITSGGESLLEVYVMQSANLRTLFFFSDDPVNEGREFIDNCVKHSNETTASMALIAANGTVDHADDVRNLRGRGNGTWSNPKKPYQFKLENRADLLQTGDPAEEERTWVLLAEASGSNLIHNRITMDMGLELGLNETSHSEFVDLYYDGDYRGTYLMAEKVEIGEGRVDERDYDNLIETWNDQIGQTDLEQLPVGEGVNGLGNTYTYIEGVAESGSPDAGAYLLELETGDATISERCNIVMKDGKIISSKNPENASQAMMEYVSTRLQEARNTLDNGGVNPENGRTLADDFDVDAFARTLLVQELSYNYDGFRFSSTYFVLPAGSMRIEPGPLWDFDLAYRYLVNGVTDDAAGFKETGGWMYAFYQCDEMVDAMRKIYVSELYPMVRDILLGDGKGQYLQSLDSYASHISASRRMNEKLWAPVQQNRYLFGFDYEGDMALLRQFLDERSQWLYDQYTGKEDANTLLLWASGMYAHVDEIVHVLQRPWNNASIQSVAWEQLSEADEENYAVWQLEVRLTPHADCTDPVVVMNGTQLPHEVMEDGTLRVLVTFEDPSYRPVDYYGDDIGWIYNYDEYILNHPEVAEIYGDDPEAVMEYFCDEGMYEDHKGNAYFRPSDVLAAHPEFQYMLGDDWSMYYWDYLYYGREVDKWTRYMGQCFWLEVENALE